MVFGFWWLMDGMGWGGYDMYEYGTVGDLGWFGVVG